MANLIIKPTSGGSLILQDEGGTAAHTIDASGNTTLAGTANNIGTTTAGTLSSGVTFPAGMIVGAALLQEQKAYNSDAGGSGTIDTRVLSHEVYDYGNIVTLSSNQFVLIAGTYIISANAPHRANSKGRGQLYIYNTTDSNSDILGQSYYGEDLNGSLYGILTTAGSKTYELRQHHAVTLGTDGLGVAVNYNYGGNVYAQVQILKIAV